MMNRLRTVRLHSRLTMIAPVVGGAVAAALGAGPWGVVASVAALGVVGLAVVERPFRALGRRERLLVDALQRLGNRDLGVRLDPRESGDHADPFNALVDHWQTTRDELRDLHDRQSLVEPVLNAMPLAFVLCGPDGCVTLANQTACDLFNAGAPLAGENFEAVLERCPSDMRKAVRSQADLLFTVDRDVGEEAYHVSRPYLELNTRRHTLYVIKHLTRELSRQEVAIWKKVIRVISHELNNSLAPVTSLIHSARLVVNNPAHAHHLEKIFDTIEERTTHLKTFLEGYARFARLAPPQKSAVEWQPFLDGVAELCGCRVEGTLPPHDGRFDPGQVQQALINLLKNATEAGGAPEETILRIGPDDEGGARLSVLDRGKGMNDDVMRQALIPFYSTKKAGTGLGLALVREIVDAHGGSIRIEGRPEGGTAVHIRLPPA